MYFKTAEVRALGVTGFRTMLGRVCFKANKTQPSR